MLICTVCVGLAAVNQLCEVGYRFCFGRRHSERSVLIATPMYSKQNIKAVPNINSVLVTGPVLDIFEHSDGVYM